MEHRQSPDPKKLQALFDKFADANPGKPRAAKSRKAYLNPAVVATPAIPATTNAAESATGEIMSNVNVNPSVLTTDAGRLQAEQIALEAAQVQLAAAKAAATQADAMAKAAAITAEAAATKAKAEADAAVAAASAQAALAATQLAKAEAEALAAKAAAEKAITDAKAAADTAAATPKGAQIAGNVLSLLFKATATVVVGIVGYNAYKTASTEDGPPAAP